MWRDADACAKHHDFSAGEMRKEQIVANRPLSSALCSANSDR
jgi:hypothetical protein